STAFQGYPVAAAFNQGSAGSSNSGTATIHFPAAGTYPYELDYTECAAGELFLVLQSTHFVAQTDPLSVYVGYADGLRPGGSIFDTSDAPITCSPTGYVPEIHVTSGGVLTTFRDSTQILNTGGIDPAVCSGSNESHAWIRIGGGGNAINSPLPPGASLDI